MEAVGEAVKQGSGETLGADNLGPALKEKIRGNHQALAFVGTTDYLGQDPCPCLGERHVPQLVQRQKQGFMLAVGTIIEILCLVQE
jgi:hypothetical protein